MKLSKSIYTLTFLLCATSLTLAQQAEKTLVKSFNLQGNQVVVMDLEGPVELKTWNNDIMRVQMTIQLENGTEAMLKSLVKAGRYNLHSTVIDEGFKVFSPGMHREVTVRGQALQESISYLVYAPERVLVKMANEASTQVVENAGDSL